MLRFVFVRTTTVSCGMPAKHINAHLLVELMIALIVVSIMMPLVLPWQQQLKNIQIRQLPAVQKHAEMIDQYTTILRDVPKLQSQFNNCCFTTASHTLCYEIKTGQFRRKKKQLSAKRFYIHSVGQWPMYTHITCTLTSTILTVNLQGEIGNENWLFLR